MNVVNLTNVLPSVVQNVIHIPRALLQSTVVNTDTSTTTMYAGEVVQEKHATRPVTALQVNAVDPTNVLTTVARNVLQILTALHQSIAVYEDLAEMYAGKVVQEKRVSQITVAVVQESIVTQTLNVQNQ